MMNTYIFEYLDENDFRKKERSVRKFNMLAYKKLTFTYYPEFYLTLLPKNIYTSTRRCNNVYSITCYDKKFCR